MLKISQFSLGCLIVFWAGQLLAQKKTDTSYIVIPFNSITYNSLNKDVKWFVDRRRNNERFAENAANSVFLSKASPFANQRWMTKNDFSSRKPLILDAKISPYISIANWTIGNKKTQNYFLFGLYLNPEFEVRIFQKDIPKGDSSLPVRTGSSRPGAELFFTHSSLYKKDRPTNYAFSIKTFHHSNGQDGEEFNSIDRTWGKRGYFNTYNGNFSDDLVFEVNGMMFLKADSGKKEQFLKAGMTFSTGLSEGIKTYNVYGRKRINLLYSRTFSGFRKRTIKDNVIRPGDTKKRLYETTDWYLVEKFRFEFYSSFITSKMNVGPIYNLTKASLADRINVHATLHWRIPGFSSAALFLETGYYGQDTYNGYFQRSAFLQKQD